MRILLNILLVIFSLAGLAFAAIYLEAINGPGMGFMELALVINWLVFFAGLAVFFLMSIFTTGRNIARGLILFLTGAAALAITAIHLNEIMDFANLMNANALDTIRAMAFTGLVPLVAIGIIPMFAGLALMFTRRRRD